MTTVTYTMTGLDGTLPAGMTEIAPNVEISSNELLVQCPAFSQAAVVANAIDYDTSAEQWISWDMRTALVGGFPSDDTRLLFGLVLNAGLTDAVLISLLRADDNTTGTLAVIDEALGVLASASGAQYTYGPSSELWHFRAHLVYHASTGRVDAAAWRDGDPTPSNWQVSYAAGNTTVSGGASGLVLISGLATGGENDLRFDNAEITDVNPGWFATPTHSRPNRRRRPALAFR